MLFGATKMITHVKKMISTFFLNDLTPVLPVLIIRYLR